MKKIATKLLVGSICLSLTGVGTSSITLAQEISKSTQTTQLTEQSTMSEVNSATEGTVEKSIEGSSTETSHTIVEQTNQSHQPVPSLRETMIQDIYFPDEPSDEDLIGDKVEPGEIPLPEDIVSMNRVSSMNTEIINKLNAGQFKVPAIQFQYTDFITKFAYADGIGKPRGVVIHETANPASVIQNEISFMKNNWKSAFVHAFVDKSNIIEVHNTDYGAWGAGRIANQYFMHVELVEHVNSRQDFLSSVNNDAYYAAYKLKQYNLKPSRASKAGDGSFTGTVWSHHEVSSLLGGTNHTDPTGYFAKFGYDMGQFYELLSYHYSKINSDIFTYTENFQAYGMIASNDQKGIYNKPYNSINAQKVDDESKYLNQKADIVGKAVNQRSGVIYYQFAINGKTIGWLDATSFTLLDKITYQKQVDFLAEVKPLEQVRIHGVYNGVYNTDPTVQELSKGDVYASQVVKIIAEAKTNHATWYQFTINDQVIGWMDSRAFNTYDGINYDKVVAVDKKIIDTTGIHKLYDKIYNTQPGVKELGKISDYQNKVVKIIREANTQHATWYQFEIAGVVMGWTDSRAFGNPDKIQYERSVSYRNVEIKSQQFSIYDGIYNTSSVIKEVGKMSDFSGKKINLTKEVKTEMGLWYQFESDGKLIGWASGNAFNIVNQLTYRSHVSGHGWLEDVTGGMMSGTMGQVRAMEAIKIDIANSTELGLSYRTHIQDIGWMAFQETNSISGTVGKAKHMEAIEINLTGNQKDNYTIYYRVHAKNFGWLDWAKNGEKAGTEGFAYHLEAIEIQLLPKGAVAPGKTEKPYVLAPPNILYQGHVETFGWQNYVRNGASSGTVGQAKRIEALRITLANQRQSGSITYQSHVQDIGWQNKVGQNQITGTSGQAKRVEAIRIELTGEISKFYDVYYRTHVQDIGWLGWAKNGESSGSARLAKRIESIQIKVVDKGTGVGSITDKPAFYGEVSNATAEGRFINGMATHVQKIAPRNDLFSSVMLAQAALESGYGTSKLSQVPNNNFFGMKAETGYLGDFVTMETKEDDGNGNLTTVKANFRKYPSAYESAVDNKNKLREGVSWEKDRYKGTWRSIAKTYQNATATLAGKYATDISYGKKLNAIIEKWNLTQFDQ